MGNCAAEASVTGAKVFGELVTVSSTFTPPMVPVTWKV